MYSNTNALRASHGSPDIALVHCFGLQTDRLALVTVNDPGGIDIRAQCACGAVKYVDISRCSDAHGLTARAPTGWRGTRQSRRLWGCGFGERWETVDDLILHKLAVCGM